MSQKPDLSAIQKRCHLQLTSKSMKLEDQQQNTLEAQHQVILDHFCFLDFLASLTTHYIQCLSQVCAGATILLCIDDAWDEQVRRSMSLSSLHLFICAPPQHFRYLNIVDTSTSSKILVSTRISGLIKNSVEVPLSLLSIEESIEMLAFGAGLDSETYPTSLVEVAKLCGERFYLMPWAHSYAADRDINVLYSDGTHNWL